MAKVSGRKSPRPDRLFLAARHAFRRAYAPYSKFPVGAALEGKRGEVFAGCNVENSSYGLTVCAERVALFSAIARGERSFTRLAIVTRSRTPVTPCGVCLQVLAEFCDDLEIISATTSGKKATYRLRELFPKPFRR